MSALTGSPGLAFGSPEDDRSEKSRGSAQSQAEIGLNQSVAGQPDSVRRAIFTITRKSNSSNPALMAKAIETTAVGGPPGRLDQRVRGMVFLTTGIAVFSIQDLIIKLLSGDYPLHQAMVIRSLTALPLLLLLVVLDGGVRMLVSPRPGLMIGRGIIMFSAYVSFYLGLAALPIAKSVVLYFTAPLFITILSVVMLGETVGPRRWAAVAIGFAGVLVMVRPGSQFFEWASLLPLYSGLAYAVSQVLTRKLGAVERASTMTFYGNGVFLLGGAVLAAMFWSGDMASAEHPSLAFLIRGWVWPTPVDFLLMAGCGIVAAAALTLLTQAYRVAPVNTVAPFEYTAVIWGTLYGWLFWHELPAANTWLGMAIIIGAGLYVLYRERQTGTPTLMRRAGWRRLRRS
ncbi:MAG TPA: DMT family transporter [Aestuariivirgaceae bacterium]|nr:DMT family transporter [Aestuariivirgaceae bacterium]